MTLPRPHTLRLNTGRVAAYSVAIARTMGLSERVIAEIEIGAILHDVGKIGIADAILLKPTPLDQGKARGGESEDHGQEGRERQGQIAEAVRHLPHQSNTPRRRRKR